MIGSISNHGLQSLYSQSSTGVSPKIAVENIAAEESAPTSPIPNDTQKVQATVTSQEGQASKNKHQQSDTQTEQKKTNQNSPIQLSEADLQ